MAQHFRRYLLINGGIILGSFLIFGIVFYLSSRLLGAKTDQILADRAAIARRATDLESLSNLKARMPEAEVMQKKIDVLLPTQDGLIGFPQFLNTMARNHSLGLSFNFASAPVPPAEGLPGQVPFIAVVEGSAENIRSFITDLENNTSKFLINIQELTFTPQASIYRVDLRGQVFFRDNEI